MKTAVKYCILGVVSVAFGTFIYAILDESFAMIFSALLPVLLGLVTAYFFNLTISPIEGVIFAIFKNKTVARRLSLLAFFLVGAGLVYVLLTVSGPRLIGEGESLVSAIPEITEKIRANTGDVPAELSKTVFSEIARFSGDLANIVGDGVSGNLATILTAFTVLILGVIFLVAKKKFKGLAYGGLSRVSLKKRWKILSFFSGSDAIIKGYYTLRLNVGGVLGTLLFLLFSAIGIPYPMLTSFLIGFFFVSPYFAPAFLAVLPFLLSLSLGGSAVLHFLLPTSALLIFAEVVLHIISQTKLNISPLSVLVSIIVGGGAFGIIGLLIFPILFSLLKLFASLLGKELKLC